MQKTEVECTFQKPSLVPGKMYADKAARKAQCQVDTHALAEATGVAATWRIFPRNAQYLCFV